MSAYTGRITAAAENHPTLREAIVALVDTAAERVIDEVKDESSSEGFDEGVMALAAAVAVHLSVGALERRAK